MTTSKPIRAVRFTSWRRWTEALTPEEQWATIIRSPGLTVTGEVGRGTRA